jgi:hypothetical protein
MTKKKLKKISKNAEFYADFESVKNFFKCIKKLFISKTSLTKLSKSENSAYFLHVFANNFFSKLFQRILNQHEILHLLYPY